MAPKTLTMPARKTQATVTPLSNPGVAEKVFMRESNIQVVRLYDVQIDPKYQRTRNNGHVNKIIKNFNPRATLYPVLSRRKVNGKWAWFIIDGQHIIEALRLMHYTLAECECFTDLTPEQEADIFYKRSTGRRGIGGWINFKSALASNQLNETSIALIIRKAKLTTGLDVQNGKADIADFNTPAVLVDQYKKLQHFGFIRLINIMAKGWYISSRDRHLQESARTTEVIRGLARFLIDNAAATDVKIVAMLKENTASSILDEAVRRAGQCHKARRIESFITEILGEKLKANQAKAAA